MRRNRNQVTPAEVFTSSGVRNNSASCRIITPSAIKFKSSVIGPGKTNGLIFPLPEVTPLPHDHFIIKYFKTKNRINEIKTNTTCIITAA